MGVSQALIAMLALDAAWVAWGLARRKAMWKWIVVYWVLLTIKNLLDLAAGLWR